MALDSSLRAGQRRSQSPIPSNIAIEPKDREVGLQRRSFILWSAAALAGAAFPSLAWARVPTAYSFDVAPPMDGSDAFIKWMQANRGEEPKYLAQRWARFQV